VDDNYGNASEFFRELVREKIQREVDADLALLESTGSSALPGPSERKIEQVLAISGR